MIKRIFGVCAASVLATSLTACFGVDAQISTAPQTNTAITTATANVKDGLTQLGNGLDALGRIDPLALNRLLAENEALRTQFQNVTNILNSAAGSGMITIATRAIKIHVLTYAGSVKVDGWLDQESNWFWQGQTFSRRDFSFGTEDSNLRPILAESQSRFFRANQAIDPSQAWDNMARAGQSYLLPKVLAWNKTNAIVPGSPADLPIDLNTRIGTMTGLHQIVLRVTPLSGDSSGVWGIQFETYLINSQNQQERISLVQASSALYPQAQLNSPLPNITQSILVKVSS